MCNSTVTANDRGLDAGGGGKLISHGGNAVAGNTVNGAFTSTVARRSSWEDFDPPAAIMPASGHGVSQQAGLEAKLRRFVHE